MDYRKIISQTVKIDGVSEEEIYAAISVPPRRENGEYCLPCFRFSKALRTSPNAIADKLKAEIKLPPEIESAESVAGYLNFKLNRAFWRRALSTRLPQRAKLLRRTRRSEKPFA